MQRAHDVVGGQGARAVGRAGVAGGQDAPHHGGQVRGEEHLGPEDLLHLGGVAVGQQAVGHEVLVDRPEVQRVLGRAPGSRDARGRIDDDPAGLDQPGPQQRGQGQPGRRRVAAGRGDQRGAAEVAPEQLGQAEDGLAQELRGPRAPRRTRWDRGRDPRAGSRPPGRRSARPVRAARARCAVTRRGAGRRRPGPGRP